MENQKLKTLLEDRQLGLQEAKEKGVKIIGYFPGNYVPEEIIYASGAIPVCLCDGGNSQPAETALSVVPQIICPFSRALIGERILRTKPYYDLLDMVVAPVTCQHLKKVAEIWEYQEDIEIMKLGVPHQTDGDFELEYFSDRLHVMKERIESFTGNEIPDDKIVEAIDLYNRLRELLRNISLMRRDPNPPLSGLEFAELNHASFYADPVSMVGLLDSLYDELKRKPKGMYSEKTRILLAGPNLANGDYIITNLIDAAGGEIVIEEICEGIRNYWQHVDNDGDPFLALAKSYLRDKLPCAFMRDSTKKRFDFITKLISDFNVSGVIWYELLCCETYDQESYFLDKKLKELNIPMLILESNYDITDVGPLRTRLEAFMEMVKGGAIDA
jgi:benzoyl-CoA reductase/2-hydroxyglutaryl-CoA dehydratase subunit BcrC/BadD/HgdB